jgi:hypothetical protein
MNIQKLGGYSAIASIGLLIILILIVLPLVQRYGLNQPGAGLDPAKVAAAYSGSTTPIRVGSILNIVLDILGLFIALALSARMNAKAPNLTRLLVIAASASCILTIVSEMISGSIFASMAKAADLSLYKPILLLQNGLSTASTNLGGWVLLLMGLAGIATRALPRLMAYIFLVLGMLRVISFALPSSTGTVGIVTLILIVAVWAIATIWLGIVLLRTQEPVPEKP